LRGRKNGIRAVFSPFGVCAPRKLQALVTADILSAHPVIFGLGVFAARTPQELETAGIHAGHPAIFWG
jgi:hypothetical protein